MRLPFGVGLRGRTVLDSDGKAVGEVESLVVETDGWRVDSLVVRLRREVAKQVGAPRAILHAPLVEVPVAQIRAVGDAIILQISAAGLRGLPSEAPSPAP